MPTANYPLPQTLLSSDDYKSLEEAQARELSARLNHCREVALAACSLSMTEDAQVIEAIDDIELDVLSILSGIEPARGVSPYVIHSSWTFECDRTRMASYISDEANLLISDIQLRGGTKIHTISWANRWGRCLERALSSLTSATTFTEAVAHLMIVDALVASFVPFSVGACFALGGE